MVSDQLGREAVHVDEWGRQQGGDSLGFAVLNPIYVLHAIIGDDCPVVEKQWLKLGCDGGIMENLYQPLIPEGEK